MGNEIVGLDIFAHHQLFIKYYPSLLSSYCSDAYALRDSAMMPYAEVQSFLNTLISKEATFNKRIGEHGTQLEMVGIGFMRRCMGMVLIKEGIDESKSIFFTATSRMTR